MSEHVGSLQGRTEPAPRPASPHLGGVPYFDAVGTRRQHGLAVHRRYRSAVASDLVWRTVFPRSRRNDQLGASDEPTTATRHWAYTETGQQQLRATNNNDDDRSGGGRRSKPGGTGGRHIRRVR